MKKEDQSLADYESVENLYREVCAIIETARSTVARSVNSSQVIANWLIGRQIINEDQCGSARADYGKQIITKLSERLSNEYGQGFSVQNLFYMRQFYTTYPQLIPVDEIFHAVRGNSDAVLRKSTDSAILHAVRGELHNRETEWRPGWLHTNMSWTHYRILLKVDRQEMRDFYEIEAIKNNWSARHLERQINSLLFQRLLKSRDKDGVLALANEGQVIKKPIDIIKDPMVLEFLDLPESPLLVESALETALLAKLQDFLLELGQGFAFIGRQRRLTLEGDDFYPDLVFYHIKLKCYVIIDLKVDKLSHGDLGQMLIYVHYYDREIKTSEENPTIGLILCTDKNDAVVQYVLDEQAKQIFTSRYCLHLPSEEELQAELRRELDYLRHEEKPE